MRLATVCLLASAAIGVPRVMADQPDERVVAVHQEPRHRLVFDSPAMRVLDVQIPPGDTTLFHIHSDPILYVTMSTSRTRSQNLGGEWSAPPSAPGGTAAGTPAVSPANPPGRLMSTTSYAERPQTHRVNNIGATLFRLIGITNSTAGDPTSTPSEGFEPKPELDNRWFRGYRLRLGTETTAEHKHANPVVIVLVAGSATVRTLMQAGTARTLESLGAFSVVNARIPHTIHGSETETQAVEIEVRQPR